MLIRQNLMDHAIQLTTLLQEHHSETYQREFQYFDGELIIYSLFHQDWEQVQRYLTRFRDHPVQSIDQLISVLDNLRLYGATELAVNLCRTTYKAVATSSQLISGAEWDLGVVVIMNLFEQAHHQLQQGETIDWIKMGADAAKFGFENTSKKRQEVATHLTKDLQVSPDLGKAFKSNQDLVLRHLLLEFCRYMYCQQQMSFVCSELLWSTVLDCCNRQERPKKQLTQPDNYFSISQQTIDKYVGQLVGGLLSKRQAQGFAVLWGIPYVYEFLLNKGIILEKTYQQAIEASTALKGFLIKGFQQSLWEYNFVHCWQRPAQVSAEEFAAETEQFVKSIKQVEPLSEEPQKRSDFSFLHGTPKQEVLAKTESPSTGHQNTAKATKSQSPQPIWEPPKPRKSPLQEAAKLSSKGKKGKSKKSNKGFKSSS
ncbi:hypothetical protein ON05_011685 [Acaryochloris sp. CCMEE 5410]|nr:hypothetical protein ON05_011685 [Acaryochloris sp. CCMEE 5410]